MKLIALASLLAVLASGLFLAGTRAPLDTLEDAYYNLTASAPAAPAPQPNYAPRLASRAIWRDDQFPLRVCFLKDANYSPTREFYARQGFDLWTAATNGAIRYEVTEDADDAPITVRFAPQTANGLTQTRYRGGHLLRAAISVGVAYGSSNDLSCIAAHEFGHALGISGHSDN